MAKFCEYCGKRITFIRSFNHQGMKVCQDCLQKLKPSKIIKNTKYILPSEIECPKCGTNLQLKQGERIKGQFSCPVCTDKSKIKITSEEDERISDRIHLSVILVNTKTEAQEVVQKLNDGANFTELIRKCSVAHGKGDDGYLGDISSQDLIVELRNVADKLHVGEYSNAIETERGYYIIKRIDENSFEEEVAEEKFNENEYEFEEEVFDQVMELYKRIRSSEVVTKLKKFFIDFT